MNPRRLYKYSQVIQEKYNDGASVRRHTINVIIALTFHWQKCLGGTVSILEPLYVCSQTLDFGLLPLRLIRWSPFQRHPLLLRNINKITIGLYK